MGYTTSFKGKLTVTPPMRQNHLFYLRRFCATRRQSWRTRAEFPDNDTVVDDLPDTTRAMVGLPVGIRGAYFIGDDSESGFELLDPFEYHQYVYCNNTPPGKFAKTDEYRRRPANFLQLMEEHGYGTPAFQEALEPYPKHERQPSLNVDIEIPDDRTLMFPDYEQKVYGYVLWVRYLIHHFFEPWGYQVTGSVSWQGESENDFGTMAVYDNCVLTSNQYGVLPAPWGHFNFTAERFRLFPPSIREVLRTTLLVLKRLRVLQPIQRLIIAKVVKSKEDFEGVFPLHDPTLPVATEKGMGESDFCLIM